MRARGVDYRSFHTSKNAVLDGTFIDSFSASERPLKTTRHFSQNDTSFSLKQAVVFIKTSRRFMSKNRLLNPNQSFEMEGGAEVKQLTLF